ncbi:MAG TPA: M64 family metallopeptidase [Candidatus Acidoferrum sp.]|nr:M64 family metallopeptidase [Candidatus Acidoferrum sp.]
MPIDHLMLEPSADLHLLKGGTGISLKVTAVSYNPDSSVPVTPQISLNSPGIVQVTGTTFNPLAVGECLVVMSYPDPSAPGVTHYLLLRVKVHNSIQSIWFGNNRISLTTGSTCLLSVYAKFDDNSYGDVSAHPYLTFNSHEPLKVKVDPAGLLTGLAAGSTVVDVSWPGPPALTDHVTVTIKDTIVNNAILERLWGSGPHTERRNLLILAEGFTSADQAVFDQWKCEIQKRLFQSKSHSPYNLLTDSWNVWAAFEPSSERGISVGYPVTVPNTDGYVTPYNFKKPDPNGPRILQTKDSRYGLIYGARPGGRTSMIRKNPPDPSEWYDAWEPYRAIGPDSRRSVLTNTYFDSLKNKDATPGTPEYDVGQRWKRKIADIAASPGGAVQTANVVTITTTTAHGLSAGTQVQIYKVSATVYNGLQTVQTVPSTTTFTYTLASTGLAASGGGSVGGVDRGLVALLIYDERDGGSQFGPAFGMTLGQNEGFHVVTGPGSKLNHEPPPSDANLDVIAATFAHELAHALGLGDEYEGSDDANHTTLNSANDGKEVEQFGNLTTGGMISVGGAINPTLIKWNWDRMAQSSKLAQDLPAPAGLTMDVVLKLGEGKYWAKALSDNTDVYMRQRIVDQPVVNALLLREGPLKVKNINGDTVTLQGAVGATSFKKGSVLYIPKKDASGQILTLIPAQVLAYIGANGAFPRSDNNCLKSNNDPEDPPSIPGFHYPRRNSDLIGLYTGGGTWNCNAYRPCGFCKMRSANYWELQWSWWPPDYVSVLIHPDFCFVCKYFIVDLIDSGQHEALEKEYPEDC